VNEEETVVPPPTPPREPVIAEEIPLAIVPEPEAMPEIPVAEPAVAVEEAGADPVALSSPPTPRRAIRAYRHRVQAELLGTPVKLMV
jgi:hypothetical protein